MDLTQFLEKYSKVIRFSEEEFLTRVWWPVWGEWGLKKTYPQVMFTSEAIDYQTNYYIDFVVVTRNKTYLIEIDDYSTHHASRDHVKKHQKKTNVINSVIDNPNLFSMPKLEEEFDSTIKDRVKMPLINLDLDTIKTDNQETIKQLYRFFVADDELNTMHKKKYAKDNEIILTDPQRITFAKINESRRAGKKRGLISLTTALGKTFIGIFHAKEFTQNTNKKILFVAHIKDILDQAKESFIRAWPEIQNDVGFYTGDEKENSKKITLATIQTLSNEKNLMIFSKEHFDTIIIDETHHATADSYSKILDYFKPGFILGLTGTHNRHDKKDVLAVYNNNLIYEITREDARDNGWIVPIELYGLKDNVDYSNIKYENNKYYESDLDKLLVIEPRNQEILEKYKERADGKKTIGFCVNIKHAEMMAALFAKEGYRASAIHSNQEFLKAKERQEINKAFRNNQIDIIFTVNAFNEGIDFPDVECLLMLRETQSQVIMAQQYGRGLRLSNGKEKIIVLNFFSNDRNQTGAIGFFGTDTGGFKHEKGKYYFDNNGDKVIFDEEVYVEFQRVEKILNANTTSDDKKNIPLHWQRYGEKLTKHAEENDYWYVGQQEKNLAIILNAINIIKSNPKDSDEDLKVKFSPFMGNPNAGKRALLIGKVLGLCNKKFESTKVFNQIVALNRKENFDLNFSSDVDDLLLQQLEKIYLYSEIFRKKDSNYNIFIWFSLYKVLLSIGEKKLNYEITIDEFKFFVVILEKYSDSINAVNQILKLRKESNESEILKYLRYCANPSSKIKLDQRVDDLFKYNKYIKFDDGYHISVKNKYVDEVKAKLDRFENFLEKFEFDEKDYENMLTNLGTPW